VQVIEHGDGPVELVAILVSTAVSADELDTVVARLQRQPGVVHANWEVSTRD
jgi:putative Mg2+ transporter-C (MgtC) family protein